MLISDTLFRYIQNKVSNSNKQNTQCLSQDSFTVVTVDNRLSSQLMLGIQRQQQQQLAWDYIPYRQSNLYQSTHKHLLPALKPFPALADELKYKWFQVLAVFQGATRNMPLILWIVKFHPLTTWDFVYFYNVDTLKIRYCILSMWPCTLIIILCKPCTTQLTLWSRNSNFSAIAASHGS